MNILGRPPKYPPMVFSVGRYLTAEDVLSFRAMPREDSTGPPLLQRLTTNHRRAAWMLAQGRTPTEVAQAVGRTPQRIMDLQSDPAFANLVAEYAKQVEDSDAQDSARIRETLVEIAELSLESIRDQLLDEPKAVSIAERRQLATMALDRTVAPPRTPTPAAPQATNITFNIAGPRLPRQIEQNENPADPIDITPEN